MPRITLTGIDSTHQTRALWAFMNVFDLDAIKARRLRDNLMMGHTFPEYVQNRDLDALTRNGVRWEYAAEPETQRGRSDVHLALASVCAGVSAEQLRHLAKPLSADDNIRVCLESAADLIERNSLA